MGFNIFALSKTELKARTLFRCVHGHTGIDHPIKPDIWFKCMAGNKKALDYVMVHCVEDVDATKKLWLRLQDYMKLTKTSI